MKTKTFGELVFREVISLVEKFQSDKRIYFKIIDGELFKSRRGVYIIVKNNHIVYCGKYEQGFSKRWVYSKFEYLYHERQAEITQALNEGADVEIFAEEESELKKQIGNNDSKWVSICGIESYLLFSEKPIWNKNSIKNQT